MQDAAKGRQIPFARRLGSVPDEDEGSAGITNLSLSGLKASLAPLTAMQKATPDPGGLVSAAYLGQV